LSTNLVLLVHLAHINLTCNKLVIEQQKINKKFFL